MAYLIKWCGWPAEGTKFSANPSKASAVRSPLYDSWSRIPCTLTSSVPLRKTRKLGKPVMMCSRHSSTSAVQSTYDHEFASYCRWDEPLDSTLIICKLDEWLESTPTSHPATDSMFFWQLVQLSVWLQNHDRAWADDKLLIDTHLDEAYTAIRFRVFFVDLLSHCFIHRLQSLTPGTPWSIEIGYHCITQLPIIWGLPHKH